MIRLAPCNGIPAFNATLHVAQLSHHSLILKEGRKIPPHVGIKTGHVSITTPHMKAYHIKFFTHSDMVYVKVGIDGHEIDHFSSKVGHQTFLTPKK